MTPPRADGGVVRGDRRAAVCVYCSSSNGISQAYLDLAAEVGAEVARRGYTLVTGGGSVSMMGAVANAARSGGAHTVGVIPRHLVAMEVADLAAGELVVVDTMRERKAEMERRADGFIALPGGIGTLEELFEVWTAGSLGMHAKPVVVLDPDGFYDPLWRWLEGLVGTGFVRGAAYRNLCRASTVEEALRAVEAGQPEREPADPSVLDGQHGGGGAGGGGLLGRDERLRTGLHG